MAWHRGGAFEIISTLGGVATYTSFAPFLGFVVINVFGFYLRWFPYRRLVTHNLWFNAPISVDGLLGRMVLNGVAGFAVLWFVWHSTARTRNRQTRWFSRLGVLAFVSLGTWFGWSQSGVGHLAVDMVKHLVLPIGTVVTLSFGETMMIMRSTMLETLGEDYILMARAKGMPDKVIRDRHAARNAILPVLTRLLLNLPFVLIGSLVIERVFFWQAMGTTLFVSIEYLDMPVIMGVLSVVGVMTVLAHILLDVIYYIMDPRLRYATVT
jgi:peptide/nickel transport system permease protein